MRYSAHARLSRVSPRRARDPCLHVCPSPPAPQVVAPASRLWAGHRPGPPPGHPCPGTPPAPSGPHPARWGLGNADVWAAPIPTASMGSRRVAARAAAEPTAGPKGHASCATLYPRVHSRAPSRAPTCAEDEVDGEDPGPSQGLDVRTWLRRIVTTGASSQDAFGRC